MTQQFLLLGNLHKRNENLGPENGLYANVQSNYTPNSPNLETTQNAHPQENGYACDLSNHAILFCDIKE